MNAKEMLLQKMIPRFPDKSRDILEREISMMSWADRMCRYGEYCVQEAMTVTTVINATLTGTENPVTWEQTQ